MRYSERTLDRARDRVSDDFEALAKAGFHVQSPSYDTDKGVAEIELVTKRTDTRAYFAKRYGKLVEDRSSRAPRRPYWNARRRPRSRSSPTA